ncbi:PucR family transcriptional regulator [Umezawaea tangerina]|uniref:DNA-binding PucR family transcriptional regulator n=1 Tax=Umezawaea tangerina TaxID=84725 RepID=A0A2T0TFS5_9PSEU|nr:PucR family transcriptional regulator [Umezawaea tangerina]PRY44478.1 DNA-binding PucR family transcriptional regulator [Umezawaea tangerina]
MPWPRPPAHIRELIRRGAEIALNPPREWLDELDEATLAGESRRAVAADPVLNAATRQTNRSNLLFWAAANVGDPGAPVPANVGAATLATARDLVRRGLDEATLDSYRVGQGVALRLWIRIAFTLTSDTEELRQLLDVTCRSISTFVDDTVAAIAARMEREREELTRGTHAERREITTLLVEGAPIGRAHAEARLGYALTPTHTAAVIWSDDPDADLSALDRAADDLATGADRPLVVLASAATRWVWLHTAPDVDRARAACAATPGVHIALGSPAPGVDGFRRSHLQALATQRMLARLSSPQQVATHDDVELVALVTGDREGADQFVQRVLGRLETAPPDLTEAVRAFLAEQCNASRAAQRLYTHRNTLLRRLARADRLLPRPLADNALEVGVALEVARWRGRPRP